MIRKAALALALLTLGPPVGAAARLVNGFRVPDRSTIEALPQRATGPLVFTGARVFDARTGSMEGPSTVVISGQRIAAVTPGGAIDIPPGAEVIHAAGMTLLPGLWDLHAHLTDVDGALYLAAGITSIRELAGNAYRSADLARAFAEGSALGPRVILAGIIDGRGFPWSASSVLADSESEARTAVSFYARLGYEQVKIYSHLKPEIAPAIIGEAHRLGLRVSGHVPAGMTAEGLARLGIDEIHHASYLLLNSIETSNPGKCLRTLAQRADQIDLESTEVRALISLLKHQDVVVDPTLARCELTLTPRGTGYPEVFRAIVELLPGPLRKQVWQDSLRAPKGTEERYRGAFLSVQKLVGTLYREGVRLAVGTDALAGFTLPRELELLVGAGVPPPQVLRMATLGAAQIANRDQELGSIEPGKLADLVLLEGDPTQLISNVRQVVLTVKDGVVYRRAELYQALGVGH